MIPEYEKIADRLASIRAEGGLHAFADDLFCFDGTWNESKHPRDEDGQFTEASVVGIEASATGSKTAGLFSSGVNKRAARSSVMAGKASGSSGDESIKADKALKIAEAQTRVYIMANKQAATAQDVAANYNHDAAEAHYESAKNHDEAGNVEQAKKHRDAGDRHAKKRDLHSKAADRNWEAVGRFSRGGSSGLSGISDSGGLLGRFSRGLLERKAP